VTLKVFLGCLAGGSLMFAATLAGCVVFLALERHRDRALINSQRQALTICRAELADCRDLLVADVEQALSPRIED
jgi:hypothetical protein